MANDDQIVTKKLPNPKGSSKNVNIFMSVYKPYTFWEPPPPPEK